MTIEGVGETRSLADALSLLCFHVRPNALNIFPLLFGSGLETLVAVAPEFWPGRSFLDLVGSFRFLPLGGTFFCRSRAATCSALGSFCILAFLSDAVVAFCCAAADEMSCGIG